MCSDQVRSCTNPCTCFFCTIKEPHPSLRRAGISTCFKEMPLQDDGEHVLALSSLWKIAMTKPDDPEFPSLGIFDCMATLIHKSTHYEAWLLRDQNIYTPYYAAHIIGSYTMNKVEFAEKAVDSGVIPPLIELLRGKISWVEQRAAVRALGHLASYKKTFEAVAVYEKEVVKLAIHLASTCLDVVYNSFLAVNVKKRPRYHRDLLTRGVGGLEMENRKAEEWASQLQCWSLHLLNCFAWKERCLDLICKQEFLKDLCEIWGGLANHSSPAGIGLIRILCYSKDGRKSVAECKQVIKSLCNVSRSSDDWQYMAIDCLVLLLKDQDTKCRVMELAALFLVDLIEIRSLGDRSNVGEAIACTVLSIYKQSKRKLTSNKVEKAMQEIWDFKVERRKREKLLSKEKVEERRVLVELIKQQANGAYWLGDVEEALVKYGEALDLCPLKLRKERMVLYSNRAQCHLLLGDPEAAISDSTRALCLSNPVNSHGKSLWRRSQAYDMKGMARESLMDCVVFLNISVVQNGNKTKRVKVPYLAARMISKQMDATWIFARAKSKASSGSSHQESKIMELGDGCHESSNDELKYDEMIKFIMERKGLCSGLSTIIEEPFTGKERSSKGELEMATSSRKDVPVARSM